MVALPVAVEPIVPPRPLAVNPRAAELLGEAALRQHGLVPFALSEADLYAASANPDLAEVARFLEHSLGFRAHVGCEIADLVEQALTAYFEPEQLPALLDDQVEAWLDALGSASLSATGSPAHSVAEAERERLEGLSLVGDAPMFRLERWALSPAIARLIPEEIARRRHALAVLYLGGVAYVATGSVADRGLQPDLEELLGCPVQLVLASTTALGLAIDRSYAAEQRRAAAESARLVRAGRVERLLAWRPSLDVLRLEEGRDDAFAAMEPERRAREQATRLKLTAVRLTGFTSLPPLAALLPRPVAVRLQSLVVSQEEGYLRVAVAGPDPLAAAETVAELLDVQVEPVIADAERLQAAIERSYRAERTPLRPAGIEAYVRRLKPLAGGSPGDAEARASRTGESLAEAMLGLKLIDQDDRAEVEGLRAGVPWLRLSHVLPALDVLQLLPLESARDLAALPLRSENGVLHVAVASLQAAEAVERATRLTVRPIVAERSDILEAVERLYSRQRRPAAAMEALLNFLAERGRLNRRQRSDALSGYAIAGLPADVALTRAGAGDQLEVAEILAEFAGLPVVDLRLFEETGSVHEPPGSRGGRRAPVDPVDPLAAQLLPLAAAESASALPFRVDEGAVAVAIADPLDEAGLRDVAQALGRPVAFHVSARAGIEAAIRRTVGQRNIGDYLVEAGIVSPEELARALELHRHTGARLGRALLTLGYVSQEQLAIFLAEQWEVPFFEVLPSELDPAVVRLVPEDVERRRGMLPLAIESDAALVAMLDPLDTVARDEAAFYLRRRVDPVLLTERHFNDALEAVYREDYLEHSANDLLLRSPEDSASRVLSRGQKIAMVLVLLAVLGGLALSYIATLSVLVSLAVAFYFAFSAYKLYLIYKALAHSLEVVITPEQLAALEDRELPVYTVLVPLYREPEVLPILIDALQRLEYPKTKLEVLLLLEADDAATIETARRLHLPESFKVLVVPNGEPKGKPKACNYGLLHAGGEFIVLYDAEDVPEPDQLKKALLAFRLGGDQLVTVQAKLNYFNRDQNLLTRWFTSEYAMWFDLLLPGLDNSGAPVPLGGTSNHFRTEALRELGGWDPYNVTEDADLGIRLFKRGYRTVVVNSTTYEEANSNLYGWIRQRSRWIKGYMQTYLVHMRHPIQLWREVGVYPFLSIQLIIAGTFFAFLVNPIFWGLTILWFATSWGLIQHIFPGPIFYIGAIALYLGNFAFVYINVAGALRREYHHLVKYTLLTPIYWMLMSIAAWKALYQLIFRPSYWEKTRHGLYQGRVRLPGKARSRPTG